MGIDMLQFIFYRSWVTGIVVRGLGAIVGIFFMGKTYLKLLPGGVCMDFAYMF